MDDPMFARLGRGAAALASRRAAFGFLSALGLGALGRVADAEAKKKKK